MIVLKLTNFANGTTSAPFYPPPLDVFDKLKRNKFISDQAPSEPEKQKTTAITGIVGDKASTFEWHRYSLYSKLRSVAYMSLSLLKFACSWTQNESITGPV